MNSRKLLMVVLLVYLAFLTRSYYWDGVLFSLRIEQVHAGELPWSELFHANHLVYSAFGEVVYTVAQFCRLNWRAITLLQIWNAVVGALIVWRAYEWMRKETGSEWAATASAVLLAFGATWWKYATDAGPYMIAIRMLLLAVLFAVEDRWLAAAACHVGSMLFHEMGVFGYFPVLAALLTSSQTRHLQRAAIYVAVTCAVVFACYWAAYAARASQGSFAAWVSSYAEGTAVTRTLKQALVLNAMGCVKLFVGGKFSEVIHDWSLPKIIGLLVCAALIAWLSPRTIPVAVRASRRSIVIWLWWLIPVALFAAWFDPGNAAHKLFLWPPLVFLLASTPWARNHVRCFLLVAVALAGWNFAMFIYPHSVPGNDEVVAFARSLDSRLPKQATVYYGAFIPDDWYLAYFAPGRQWKLLDERKGQGSDCFETTAIDRLHLQPQWKLNNARHHIEVTCQAQ